MTRQVEGKIALITGGSSGIGQATALAFSREGAKVVIADVNVESGEATLHQVKETGSEAIFVKTDVTKAIEVEKMMDKIITTYGRLDYALNDVGVIAPYLSRVLISQKMIGIA